MGARLSGAALTIGICAALALPWAVARGDASGVGGGVRSDAPGIGFDPTPVILAERRFERPSVRPGAVVVIHPARPARLSDAAPPGRLDGWLPLADTTTDAPTERVAPSRRWTTK
jgi:hypothetical protein